MAKRGALTDLNHDNWDQQESDEEVGTFKRANEAEIQKRVIKKAARRLDSSGSSSQAKSVFGGFSGFGTTTQAAKPAAATFSFLNSAATPTPPTFGTITATTVEKKTDDKIVVVKNGSNSNNYGADLKKLNMEFAKWIQECVNKNPHCILTPVFDDYRKYIKELDEEKNKAKVTENEKQAPPATTFKFGDLSKPIVVAQDTKIPETKITFGTGKPVEQVVPSFGAKVDDSKSASFSFARNTDEVKPPAFSFGAPTKTDASPKAGGSSSTFSFGNNAAPSFGGFGTTASTADKPFSFASSSKPFSFSNVTQPAAVQAQETTPKKDDNTPVDDDEPPKVEFTPVVEEDSVYNKRCKVFVKQDGEYKDRGVGMLYIKSVDDGKKTQVIVRADTSLGNLLLNTLLSTSTPTKAMGKNNVMIVASVDSKPTSILLRVKTGDDAKELLDELEKHKK